MVKIISSVLFLIFISLFCAGIIWDKKGLRIERPARAVGVFLFIVGMTIVGVDIERKAYDEAYSNAFVDQKKKIEDIRKKIKTLDDCERCIQEGGGCGHIDRDPEFYKECEL